jgi:hypothetical protein
MRKLTRLEANKEVRRVLNRHNADLSYVQYSVAGTEIRLTGFLVKIDATDFTTNQIEVLIQEFQRKLPGYYVTGDMENWNFSIEHIIYVGEKKDQIEEDEPPMLPPMGDYDSEAS